MRKKKRKNGERQVGEERFKEKTVSEEKTRILKRKKEKQRHKRGASTPKFSAYRYNFPPLAGSYTYYVETSFEVSTRTLFFENLNVFSLFLGQHIPRSRRRETASE